MDRAERPGRLPRAGLECPSDVRPVEVGCHVAGHEAVAGPVGVDNTLYGLGVNTVEDALGVHSDGAGGAEGAHGDLDTLVDARAQEVFWGVKPVTVHEDERGGFEERGVELAASVVVVQVGPDGDTKSFDVLDGVARGLGEIQYDGPCLRGGVEQSAARDVRHDVIWLRRYIEVKGDATTGRVHEVEVAFAGAVGVRGHRRNPGASQGCFDVVRSGIGTEDGVKLHVDTEVPQVCGLAGGGTSEQLVGGRGRTACAARGRGVRPGRR